MILRSFQEHRRHLYPLSSLLKHSNNNKKYQDKNKLKNLLLIFRCGYFKNKINTRTWKQTYVCMYNKQIVYCKQMRKMFCLTNFKNKS